MFDFGGVEEQEKFEKWAFGTSPVQYSDPVRMTWNSRFGMIYYCHSDELINESIEKMYEVYELHKKLSLRHSNLES